jgi:hypothetical protein
LRIACCRVEFGYSHAFAAELMRSRGHSWAFGGLLGQIFPCDFECPGAPLEGSNQAELEFFFDVIII